VTPKLRIAVLGRTEMLLEAARQIAAAGHVIGLVGTCRASGHELSQEAEFQAFAESVGAPFLQRGRINSPEAVALVRESRCDLAISMNWLTLIPQTVRNLFPHGIFNAHPGDLPRYKGNACPNWAILMGEPHVALTIHAMIDELDAGPIASKAYFNLSDTTYIGDIYQWLHTAVPRAFLDLIDQVASSTLTLTPQHTEGGLRCYPRRPADGRIDWSASPHETVKLVRASGNPFSGAFTTLEGEKRLIVWRAAPEPAAERFLAIPGQIAYRSGADPIVVSGNGYVRLIDVSLEGCKTSEDAKAALLSSLRQRLI
jgi:methionyl-tRNA formyltransferase